MMMAASVLPSACGVQSGPGEVVREFFQHLQNGRRDSAMELLAPDLHEEMLEEFEGKQIVRFTIDEIDISEDGCSAAVSWNAEVIDENSPDTDEGNEMELTRSSDGTWLITDL
ncbi:MAG: hypothetical protein JXR55_01285 [Candidatus Fermentibacteraceae bacterium]|nr:hypothetical protein [Candidatus Fermentibacteraceae bacterium]